MSAPYVIHATWDKKTKLWVSSCAEIPTLAISAQSMEALTNELKVALPGLLDETGLAHDLAGDIAFSVLIDLPE